MNVDKKEILEIMTYAKEIAQAAEQLMEIEDLYILHYHRRELVHHLQEAQKYIKTIVSLNIRG